MNHFSVCTGIGGIDIAAEVAGFITVGQCEINDYCNQVLEKYWPGLPRWRDIRDVTAESIRARGITRVDLLSGGIPCQPHSLAGKRQASADERDLWGEFARIIREVGPKWILVENVRGLLSSEAGRFFGRILRDLAQMGYNAGWCVYGAEAIGAPHRRERVFIVGYPVSGRLGGQSWRDAGQITKNGYIQHEARVMADTQGEFERRLPFGKGKEEPGPCIGSQDVAYTEKQGLQERGNRCGKNDSQIRKKEENEQFFRFTRNSCDGTEKWNRNSKSGLGGMLNGAADWLHQHRWPAGLGQPQHMWEPPRVATGTKNRVARLKALGNMCMPIHVYPILNAIAEIEKQL